MMPRRGLSKLIQGGMTADTSGKTIGTGKIICDVL